MFGRFSHSCFIIVTDNVNVLNKCAWHSTEIVQAEYCFSNAYKKVTVTFSSCWPLPQTTNDSSQVVLGLLTGTCTTTERSGNAICQMYKHMSLGAVPLTVSTGAVICDSSAVSQVSCVNEQHLLLRHNHRLLHCSTRNSSGDEIANVNFLYDDIVHALKIQ